MEEKRQIYGKIIEFVMSKKLHVSYRLFAHELEEEIKLKHFKTSFQIGTNEEASLRIKNSFDRFANIIRNMEIPLHVVSMQGVSDVFSYSDPFPQIPSTYTAGKKVTELHKNKILIKNHNMGMVPRYVAPVECILNLSHSSKWPEDLEAIRAFIVQFYFHFEEYLRTKNNIHSIVTKDYADVFFEGLVFRVKLYQAKEVILLKKQVTPLGTVSYKDNKDSIAIERNMHYLPTLQAALSG